MKTPIMIVLIWAVIILACISTTPIPSPTPTPTPLPVFLPLNAPSTGWNFVIQEAYVHTSVTRDTHTVVPENGAFLVLIGNLENNDTSSGCITTRAWELTNSNTGQEYDYAFYAEPVVKNLYSLDASGSILGTCLASKEKKRLFVVFDIDPTAELTLIFRKQDGGQPVQLHSALSIINAPSLTTTQTSTTINAQSLTATSVYTANPTATPDPYIWIGGDWPNGIWDYIFNPERGARGHLKVYMGEQKSYIFEIIGAATCSSMPSGQGYLVRYPNGDEEWKDRRALENYELFVLKDELTDTFIDFNWNFYQCP